MGRVLGAQLFAGVNGQSRNVYAPDWKEFQPRAGFAYHLAPHTVIRGGFGVTYDVLFYNVVISEGNNYPRIVSSIIGQPATNNLFPTLSPKTAVVPPFNPATVAFVNSPVNTKHPATDFWSHCHNGPAIRLVPDLRTKGRSRRHFGACAARRYRSATPRWQIA